MAHHESEVPNLTALRDQVLRDPFGLESAASVRSWFDQLMSQYPLWAFSAWAYYSLRERTIPSNYPLQHIIRSIVEDEGMTAGKKKQLTPLERLIDLRRYRLADIGRFQPRAGGIGKLEGLPTGNGPSSFNCLRPLPMPVDVDSEAQLDPWDVTSWRPEFAKIGREIMRIVEAKATARDKTEREKHSKELQEFEKRIASELGVSLEGPGRLPEGPQSYILKAIVEQGRTLIELCWDLFPVTVNEKTAKLLSSQGVQKLEDQQQWCARLLLPILSKPEILALRSEQEKANRRTRRSGAYPTPRRFTIWVVARRLGLAASTTARKALHTDAPQYFVKKSNPIDDFRKA